MEKKSDVEENAVALEKRNRAALAAWNSWKEVCWVAGIGKSLDGKKAIGTSEQANILRTEIERGFRRKIDPFWNQLANESGNSVLDDLDYADVFDNKIVEYETVDRVDKRSSVYADSTRIRKKKAWKDFVWSSVAASEDEPLKVIRGKLIGKEGVINQIVEEWLMENYSCVTVKDKATGKEILKFATSLEDESHNRANQEKEASDSQDSLEASATVSQDASVDDAVGTLEDDDRRTVEGDGPSNGLGTTDYGVADSVLQQWRVELGKCFNARQCCLFLANGLGVKIYDDPEILSALGIGKTTAAATVKDFKDKPMSYLSALDPEARDWILKEPMGAKFFIKWIKSRALAEKAGRLILSRSQQREMSAK